jgi:hypothetical protein
MLGHLAVDELLELAIGHLDLFSHATDQLIINGFVLRPMTDTCVHGSCQAFMFKEVKPVMPVLTSKALGRQCRFNVIAL